MNAKEALAGLLPGEIAAMLKPLPPYRGKQICRWIVEGARSFGEMSDLPLALRKELDAGFTVYSSHVEEMLRDEAGTVKLSIALHDGERIESVMLVDLKGRKTACLSTQAGCPAGCVFCKTGALGFRRNLNASEIAEQFLHIRAMERDVSHIVIMGMGEPLFNLGELRKALLWFCGGEGPGLSPRRITVSTCGVPPGILELAEKGPPVRLAVSLTTADQALREALMPIAKTVSLPALRESLLAYQQKQGRRITLEAALLSGVNTRREDAEAIARFIRGSPPLDAALNLIPWNPVEGLLFRGRPLAEPGPREIAAFTGELERRGLKVTRRFRRGGGIAGACGQLGGGCLESRANILNHASAAGAPGKTL